MNIYEFSRMMGLSTGTVSRAINNRDGVSKKTRDLVLRSMVEWGYRPNAAAASLASGRSQMIALWTPGLASSYVSEILVHLEAILEADDHDLVVFDVERKRGNASKLADLFRWPADGVLSLDGADWLPSVAAFASTPIVSFGVFGSCEGVDHVSVDLKEGVEQATEHLVAQGCRRIAMVLPYSYNAPGYVRLETYSRVLARHGLPPEIIETPSLMPAQAIGTVRDYIAAHGHPDGIFCFNDELGIATYRALRDHGLRIPADVLLVGCDGVAETQYLDPPLATIKVPVQAMCAAAWSHLRDRLANPELTPQSTQLSAHFLRRPSACR